MPQQLRGKYPAFALQDSAGVSHLRSLQAAGLSHVHLLPSYDYGSVPERTEDQATIKVGCQYKLIDLLPNFLSILFMSGQHIFWNLCLLFMSE